MKNVAIVGYSFVINFEFFANEAQKHAEKRKKENKLLVTPSLNLNSDCMVNYIGVRGGRVLKKRTCRLHRTPSTAKTI